LLIINALAEQEMEANQQNAMTFNIGIGQPAA
jgi:hypothetical protein